MKMRRTLQERSAERKALLGVLQTQPSNAFAEIAGMCGLDFVILDNEHGVFTASQQLETLQVLGGAGIAALVRIESLDLQSVGRLLDMGADGIVVPNISTAAEARAAARAMQYPPVGTRGFGASVHRSTRYGLDTASHLKDPRAGLSLIVMIESKLGVDNVDDILSVDGVDAVLIGPSDLSANLGCIGDFAHPAYLDALRRIERAATERGKILGTAPHAGAPVDALLARGYRFLILGADTMLMREAVSGALAKAQSFL
jgi:4-hydroxy-2-oxoheptanedioate aldolase